ncbi:MAG TPA: hypothetical protein VMI32_07270 [Candidatus Solibacter sp.]|nr:hypothetical protein [Candidatus Solibacter sp.]
MPPTIYLDQSALIDLFNQSQQDSSFEKKVQTAIATKALTIVLSPWHWIETARTKDVQKASSLANFMDALDPIWLRDRRELESIEIQESFFGFVGVPYARPQALVTRAELISAMNGVQLTAAQVPSSQEFVEGWIIKPELMDSVIKSYQANAEALRDLRVAVLSGKLTPEFMKEADRKHIAMFLPERTPSKVVIDQTTKNNFLDTKSIYDFPCLSIESAIAEYSWKNAGRDDWNSMVDKFHLISAMPYADIIVSDDRYFMLLLPIAQATGFAKAKVIKYRELCQRFLA